MVPLPLDTHPPPPPPPPRAVAQQQPFASLPLSITGRRLCRGPVLYLAAGYDPARHPRAARGQRQEVRYTHTYAHTYTHSHARTHARTHAKCVCVYIYTYIYIYRLSCRPVQVFGAGVGHTPRQNLWTQQAEAPRVRAGWPKQHASKSQTPRVCTWVFVMYISGQIPDRQEQEQHRQRGQGTTFTL